MRPPGRRKPYEYRNHGEHAGAVLMYMQTLERSTRIECHTGKQEHARHIHRHHEAGEYDREAEDLTG